MKGQMVLLAVVSIPMIASATGPAGSHLVGSGVATTVGGGFLVSLTIDAHLDPLQAANGTFTHCVVQGLSPNGGECRQADPVVHQVVSLRPPGVQNWWCIEGALVFPADYPYNFTVFLRDQGNGLTSFDQWGLVAGYRTNPPPSCASYDDPANGTPYWYNPVLAGNYVGTS